MAEKNEKNDLDVPAKDKFEKVSEDLILVSGKAIAKVWDPEQKKELYSKRVEAVFIKKVVLRNVTKTEDTGEEALVEFYTTDIKMKDGTTESINCNKPGANKQE